MNIKTKILTLTLASAMAMTSIIGVYADGKFVVKKGTVKAPVERPYDDPDAALISHLDALQLMKKSGSWNVLGRPVSPPASADTGYKYTKGLDFSWYKDTGSQPLSSQAESYRKTVEKVLANDKYTDGQKIDANLVLAIIMTESGGNKDEGKGRKYGQGLMQIEYYPHRESFYWCGTKLTGKTWNDSDFFVAEKNIIFGVRLLSALHKKYGDDYNKIIQGYNFSSYSVDSLVKVFGDKWMDHRAEVGQYNGKGTAKYGNPKYVEKVLTYYHAKN